MFNYKSKLITLEDFSKIKERLNDKKIVFTNGCFDILHPGHMYLLEKAKTLGDVLIVGLNSDTSVKILKGEKRPFYSQQERAYMLSCLSCVDFIIIFEEETPIKLIETIEPDILVKGSDWNINEVVGKSVIEKKGGKIFLVSLLEKYSTSVIIEKIIQKFLGE